MPPIARSLGLNYAEPSLTVGLLPRRTKTIMSIGSYACAMIHRSPTLGSSTTPFCPDRLFPLLFSSVFSDTIRTSL